MILKLYGGPADGVSLDMKGCPDYPAFVSTIVCGDGITWQVTYERDPAADYDPEMVDHYRFVTAEK